MQLNLTRQQDDRSFCFSNLFPVRLAIDSMEMLNSPVIDPASAVAVKSSEEEEEIATERALNRSSFCSAEAELLKYLGGF